MRTPVTDRHDPWWPLAEAVEGRLWSIGPSLARITRATATGGPIYGGLYQLEASLEGTTVRADLVGLPHRGALSRDVRYDAWVVARVEAPGAGPLRLTVRRGHVYAIGRALGIQDEPTGDEAFDDRFVNKTNLPALMRAWLDVPARQALLAADDFSYALAHERVIARGRGDSREPAPLAAGLRAAAVLADRSRRLREAWLALASRLGGELRDVPAPLAPGDEPTGPGAWLELPAGQGTATLDVATGAPGLRAGLWTRLRARRVGAVADRYVLRRAGLGVRGERRLPHVGEVDGWECLGRDASRVRARLGRVRVGLAACGLAALIGEPDCVWGFAEGWPGPDDADRLGRAASVVAELAEEVDPAREGPYR